MRQAILKQLLLLVFLPLLLLALLLLVANTDSGRRLIVWGLADITHGQLLITGLSGNLPLAPRLAHLEWRNQEGVWLQIDDVALDLNLWKLRQHELVIETLSARRVVLTRRPPRRKLVTPPRLPLPLRLQRLTIGQFALAESVVTVPLTLGVTGSAVFTGITDLEADLRLSVPDRTDQYQLSAQVRNGQANLQLDLNESPDGLLARIARQSGLAALTASDGISVTSHLAGTRDGLTLDAALASGAFSLTAKGSLDPTLGAATQLHVVARAPALRFAPDARLAWRQATLTADLSGPWHAPQGKVQTELSGLTLSSVTLDQLTACATLTAERLRLDAVTTGFRLPFALPARTAQPLRVAAELNHGKPDWPFQISLHHALLDASVMGQAKAVRAGLDWTLALPNLAGLIPRWSGTLQSRGRLTGGMDAPEVTAILNAEIAAPLLSGERQRGRLAGQLDARLVERWGTLKLTGDWAGQPIVIDLSAGTRPGTVWQLALGHSHWASLTASGAMTIAPATGLLQGELQLGVERLADLAPFLPLTATPLDGRLALRLALPPDGTAEVIASGEELRLPADLGIGKLDLNLHLHDLQRTAEIQSRLRLDRLSFGSPEHRVTGTLTATVDGSATQPDLTLKTDLNSSAGRLRLDTAGRLTRPARRLAVQRLTASVGDENLRLLAPMTLDLADGVAVDHLRLGLRTGSVDIAGRVMPTLDLRATLVALPLELLSLAAPVSPLLGTITGTLSGTTQLSGTLSAPLGSCTLQAQGLRITRGAARSLPPLGITAKIQLEPSTTSLVIDSTADAANHLGIQGRIAGSLPRLATAPLDLRAHGRLNLNLLDPLLTGGGRQLHGQIMLDTQITGTPAIPRLNGTAQLTNAAFWDRTIGLAITQVAGNLSLSGDSLRLERLAGTAGEGSLVMNGSLGVFAAGFPLDLTLTARNARPFQSDLLDVRGDADLRLSGSLAEGLRTSGTMRLSRVEVHLPERLPPNVATLKVRERGAPRAAEHNTSGGMARIALDLMVAAPRAFYLRGRGIDAELGGSVQLAGTVAVPVISGGVDLLRGHYELAGQNLGFNRGRIEFDGASGLDPNLDLESRVTTAGSTAILSVRGRVSAPRIVLRGEPDMPESEVLSRLLFGVAGGNLSAVQSTRLGIAAAALAGIKVDGLNIIGRARSGLGLDRFNLGTDEKGRASLEGGRYLSESVYLGVRQNTQSVEPQGVVRIDVTPNLRLEADLGASSGTRAGAAYEIEY